MGKGRKKRERKDDGEKGGRWERIGVLKAEGEGGCSVVEDEKCRREYGVSQATPRFYLAAVEKAR